MPNYRLANSRGRAVLLLGDRCYDVERHSQGRLPHTIADLFERTAELRALAGALEGAEPDGREADLVFDTLSPAARQIFGIGVNYLPHIVEMQMAVPETPLTFAKFVSSLNTSTGDIPLSGDKVDYEVELVAVIGKTARHVPIAQAWDYVAGLTVGNDVSDRHVQKLSAPAQFSLGKSFPGFCPVGPVLVPSENLSNRDDLRVWCDVNGQRLQEARTSDMLFSVSKLVAYLSSICTLYPGDLIFTGTPGGVGDARGVYLKAGDVIETGVEGVGVMTNRCVSGEAPLLQL